VADAALLKAYERAKTIIERDDLTTRLPHLDWHLAFVEAARPGPLQDRLLQTVVDTITTYEQTRRDDPFLPRPTTVTGTFSFVAEKRTRRALLFESLDFASHTLIGGGTGSAKSALASNIVTSLQVADPSVDVNYVDPKPDWQYHAARDERCIIIHKNFPLCVTIPPSFISRDYYEQLLAKTFAECFYGAAHTMRLWTDANRQARAAHPRGHSIADTRYAMEHPTTKDFTFQDKDTRRYGVGQLDLILAVMPGVYHAKPPRCFTMEDLCRHPVYWPMPSRFSTYEFLIPLYVQVLIHYLRVRYTGQLQKLLVMDEGLQLWQADARHRITGTPLLDHAVSQTRSLGLGFLITTTSLRQVSPMIRANTNLQVVTRLVDGSEVEDARRTFRLTPDQTSYLHDRLPRGECLLRLSHKYPEPLLCTFTKPTHDPNVSASVWKAAKDRANLLLPNDTPVIQITTQEAQPERAPLLNKRETAVLRRISTGRLAPATAVYTELGLSNPAGDQIKNHLLTLGMIEATSVKLHGHRGRPGVILSETPHGLAHLGLQRTRLASRGGGIAHTYYCQELRDLLGGEMEVSLSLGETRKCVDVLVLYNQVKHQPLLEMLRKHATVLNHADLTLGRHLAFEVEMTTDTVSNNARKDAQAGLDVVVLAMIDPITPALVQQLRNDVPEDHWQRIVLVPLLTLLDNVRASFARQQ
jgi:hypothetical protein